MIIFTIIISLVISLPLDNEKTNLKLSSLLKVATNLGSCSGTQTDTFLKFEKPADATYVLYNIGETNTKYSFINEDNIIIAKIKVAGTYDTYISLDIYTYTASDTSDTTKISNIVGTTTVHYEFKADGTELSDQTLYYEAGDSTAPKYEIQLVHIKDATPLIQSTCEKIDYTAEGPAAASTAILDFFTKTIQAKDHAETYVAKTNRESLTEYLSITEKRMSVIRGNRFNTFYTKANKICSLSYDGDNIYTVYHSVNTDPTTLTPSADKLASISEGKTKTKYVITCEGDIGKKACSRKEGTSIIEPLSFTIVQSNADTKPFYVFKEKVFYGTNNKAPEIQMEKTAIEIITKLGEECSNGINPINNVNKYVYNIVILLLLTFIYMI